MALEAEASTLITRQRHAIHRRVRDGFWGAYVNGAVASRVGACSCDARRMRLQPFAGARGPHRYISGRSGRIPTPARRLCPHVWRPHVHHRKSRAFAHFSSHTLSHDLRTARCLAVTASPTSLAHPSLSPPPSTRPSGAREFGGEAPRHVPGDRRDPDVDGSRVG
jgi:hypothetical protein